MSRAWIAVALLTAGACASERGYGRRAPTYEGRGEAVASEAPSMDMDAPAAPAPAMAPSAARAPGGRMHLVSAQRPATPTTPTTPRAAETPARGPLLIYTAHLTLAVFEVDAGLRATEALAKELGGFLAQQAGTGITIRVPAERFDEALRRVEKIGDVTNRNVQADDVTQEHLDLEVRLKNARAVRDRLEQLLNRATKVDESIAIERELERVAREVEQMEGRLKFLKDRVAFSTLTVVFNARRAETLSKETFRLPFRWLDQLGLARLMQLGGAR